MGGGEMAQVHQNLIRAGAVALALLAGPTLAGAQTPSALYEQPVLVIDPGMHTAPIKRADTDRQGRFAVTGSDDKTVRVWSLTPQPKLLRTIRIPSGPGNVGKIFAVAMSPDGALIAAGGWTGSLKDGEAQKIYLFSRDGKLVKRIDGLPEVVGYLTFSPDGRTLAAGLGGANGIRIFDRDRDWAEIARDTDYGGRVQSLAFAPDGRLATATEDGKVRLYDARFSLMSERRTVMGQDPYSLAFNPDDGRLAVGFYRSTSIALLNGQTLVPLKTPDVSGIDNGDLSDVAWSHDGKTLYAGGTFDKAGRNPIVAWADGGLGARRLLFSGAVNSIGSLKALPDGALLVTAGDPHLAILGPDGRPRWEQGSPNFDPRGQESNFAVSADGSLLDYGYAFRAKRGPALISVT